jgi:glycosyltransferase involved in cell wall biosynthesis
MQRQSLVSKPLRVLYLIDSLKMGGAERITVALMPFLTEITPIVGTLYDHESPLLQQLGTVQHIRISGKRLADPGAIRRYLGALRHEKIDLVHAQLQHGTVFAAISRLLTGIPFVVTRHVVEDDVTSDKKRRLVYVEHLALRSTSRLIYVSDATRQYHSQSFPFDPARCRTIYNGIDISRFPAWSGNDAARKATGLPTGKPLVVMVGVMRPRKGHDVCIDAAKLVPDANFVLVGDGDADVVAALHAQAAGLTNVHFLGTRKDIPEILSAADMLVLPSDSEALPTVLIEAGAAGLPVIASTVGGVMEIVNADETGILIPPRDPSALASAVQSLLNDPVRMRQMGEKGRKTIEQRFTLERQAQELTALYHEVLKK